MPFNIVRKLFSKISNPDCRPSKKTALALAVAVASLHASIVLIVPRGDL
jgi:hypothetical protein